MTWREFVVEVERQMKEKNIPEDVKLNILDWWIGSQRDNSGIAVYFRIDDGEKYMDIEN